MERSIRLERHPPSLKLRGIVLRSSKSEGGHNLMSELIPHHFRISRCYIESGGGLIRRRLRLRLTSLSFRKSSALIYT
jgi:hypothetical protein